VPPSRRTGRRSAPPLLGRGWIQPHWLERQADPDSPAYVVGGADPSNVTGRNWTLLGNLGSPYKAGVDRRGLIQPGPGSWSLDWWIRGAEGWVYPSRKPGVRQTLLDLSPVTETSLGVNGGQVTHRAFATSEGGEHVVVEIHNATPEPVAVALVVRPYGLVAPVGIGRIERDGLEIRVDGELGLVLPREPGQTVASNLGGGDCAYLLETGREGFDLSEPVECDSGLAHAAFIFPLVHTSTLRARLPLERGSEGRRLWKRGSGGSRSTRPAETPPSDQVARGWKAVADRGTRWVLPPGRLSDAVTATSRSILLHHHGARVGAQPLALPGHCWREAAYVLGILGRLGHHTEVEEVLRAIPDIQRPSGEIPGREGEIDATSAALVSVGVHTRLTADPGLARDLADSVAGGARYIARQRKDRRARDDYTRGLVFPRETPHGLEYRYADNFWALRALTEAAFLLGEADEPTAAADAMEVAADLRVDLVHSLEAVVTKWGDDALPATPHRPVDERSVDALVAAWPNRVFRPDHPMITATREAIVERFLHGPAHHATIGPRGLGTYRTLRLGMVELLNGMPEAMERLDWFLSVAGPTFNWPPLVHPRLGSGTAGEGDDGMVKAHFLAFVRSLLVHEEPGDNPGLVLLGVYPPAWLGHGIEVHDAPTFHGRLSYAVRWHGDRPALLWELDRGNRPELPVRLTVPGLDRSWSSTEVRGEALLQPPAITLP